MIWTVQNRFEPIEGQDISQLCAYVGVFEICILLYKISSKIAVLTRIHY